MNSISCFFLTVRVTAITAFFGSLTICYAQEARVAESSVSIRPLSAEKKIEVSLRLADDPAITSVTAATVGGAVTTDVPALWKSVAATPEDRCAWLVVIDTSNPARGQTVAACVTEIRQFISRLPANDAAMVATLARDLTVVTPFETPSAARDTALGAIRVEGEGAYTTLIYQNLRQALKEHLAGRKESRKAVVVLTDGKDETGGGPEAIRVQVKELIAAAKEAKVAVHTLGFAEKATEATFFGDLKDLSFETDGLHFAADVATRRLPPQVWPTITGVMHGGGTAVLDLSKLPTAVPVAVTFKTAAGKSATFTIEQGKVAEAIPAKPEPSAADPAKKDAPSGEMKDDAEKMADPEAKGDPDAGKTGEPVAGEPAIVAEEAGRQMPNWLPWAIGSALLVLAIIAAIVVSRKRSAEEARRAEALRRAEEERRLREEQEEREAQAAQAMPAPKPALAHLEMCDAEQTRFPVTMTNIKIGRGQHNDLVFRNDSISGNHCVLQQNRQGEWIITDQASGNGVLVNGERIQQIALRHGDTIELGDLKMRFLLR